MRAPTYTLWMLLLLWFVECISGNEDNKIERQRNVTIVRKCCPSHKHFNRKFACVEGEQNRRDKFHQAVSELHHVINNDLRIESGSNILDCPIQNRRLFDVLGLANDKAYILPHDRTIYDDDIFKDMEEMDYICLDLGSHYEVVALVCNSCLDPPCVNKCCHE